MANTLLGNRYLLTNTLLGQGGEAEVFEAIDTRLGVPCALKLLHDRKDASQGAKDRLQFEATFWGHLDCVEGMVRPLDFVENQGGKEGPFLVMELLRGQTLQKCLQTKGPLKVEKLGELAQKLCRIVSSLHAKGWLHRDLSAPNVFLCQTGEVRVLDFGGAYRLESQPSVSDKAFLGTYPYRAPERDNGFLGDVRSDIYSLGVLLYEMACAKPLPLFPHDANHALKNSLRPRDTVPSLPPRVEKVIVRCLSALPEKRYQTVEALSFALSAATGVTMIAPEKRENPPKVQELSRAKALPYAFPVRQVIFGVLLCVFSLCVGVFLSSKEPESSLVVPLVEIGRLSKPGTRLLPVPIDETAPLFGPEEPKEQLTQSLGHPRKRQKPAEKRPSLSENAKEASVLLEKESKMDKQDKNLRKKSVSPGEVKPLTEPISVYGE